METAAAPPLLITNTLSRTREPFQPLVPGEARMYHCGPTVNEPSNLDKFRSYLLGDLLRRVLETRGLKVRQVMNITDVGHLNEFNEDAVEVTAGRSGLSALELAAEEEKAFHDDRRSLRILDSHVYPRAHEHVQEMIEFIEKLLAGGAAYRSGGSVLFDVGRSRSLGRLMGKTFTEVEEVARQSEDPSPSASTQGKRHPLDFHLWRSDAAHQMHWPSPWGRGFPGWHVECVVMGRKYLGEVFDIHSGGEGNVFPHHECEMAQAEAAGGGPLARYWLHSGHVLFRGRPISRSNRNLITVRGLRESGVSGPEIRAALLSVHYRQPFEMRPELIDEARDNIELLRSFRDRHRAAGTGPAAVAGARERIGRAETEFSRALAEDLDFPAALRAARGLAIDLDPAASGPLTAAAEAMDRFDRVLGFL
jgi:cysteinyl-tRNA synthetase